MADWTFGALLMQHRTAAGLNATELAGMADCDQTYIGKLERGSKRPSRAAVLALARMLGLNVSQTDRLLYVAGHATETDYQRLYEARCAIVEGQERWCRQCRLARDRSAFGRDLSKSDGLRNICKSCDAVRISKYRTRVALRGQARRAS